MSSPTVTSMTTTLVSSPTNNGSLSLSSNCEDDVMRIKLKLDRMMKGGSESIDIKSSMEMLDILKKAPIDLQILKNTGIGVALNNLRKSCNSDELGSLAKSLLKNWKKLVASEQVVHSPNSNSNDSKGPISPKTTTASVIK
jgi:transcription elongation factor S-II